MIACIVKPEHHDGGEARGPAREVASGLVLCEGCINWTLSLMRRGERWIVVGIGADGLYRGLGKPSYGKAEAHRAAGMTLDALSRGKVPGPWRTWTLSLADLGGCMDVEPSADERLDALAGLLERLARAVSEGDRDATRAAFNDARAIVRLSLHPDQFTGEHYTHRCAYLGCTLGWTRDFSEESAANLVRELASGAPSEDLVRRAVAWREADDAAMTAETERLRRAKAASETGGGR